MGATLSLARGVLRAAVRCLLSCGNQSDATTQPSGGTEWASARCLS